MNGQEKDILTLSVSSNPSVLKGKAFVVYDVTTGDATAYNAEKLANIEYKDLSM